MVININAICDECGKESKVDLKEKRHPGKVIEAYFCCKHCNKKYFCFATDPEIRELQDRVQTEKSPFIRQAMINRIKSLKEKLREELA